MQMPLPHLAYIVGMFLCSVLCFAIIIMYCSQLANLASGCWPVKLT
uniref:Uncharacterized protein n=1 Tax=Anguilla anguilla TaxID=7936 RepID=A0A0E9QFW4_ANGAN